MRAVFGTFALMLLAADAAKAADPIEDIPPGPDEIVGVRKGQAVPFDGQLFGDDTALRWANWLKQYKLRLRVDVREQQQLCAVRVDAMQKLIDTEVMHRRKLEQAYEVKLSEVTNPPWYKSPTFYVVIGVAGTMAAIAGGYAVGASF